MVVDYIPVQERLSCFVIFHYAIVADRECWDTQFERLLVVERLTSLKKLTEIYLIRFLSQKFLPAHVLLSLLMEFLHHVV